MDLVGLSIRGNAKTLDKAILRERYNYILGIPKSRKGEEPSMDASIWQAYCSGLWGIYHSYLRNTNDSPTYS